MRDPLRPPVKTVRNELVKAALRVARLTERVRRKRRELEALDAELASAKLALRDLVSDAAASDIETLRRDAEPLT
jgi:hypothetical protein